MPVDPVCGMEISESEAAGTSTYKGQTYYFCATACKETFDENPAEFIEGLSLESKQIAMENNPDEAEVF